MEGEVVVVTHDHEVESSICAWIAKRGGPYGKRIATGPNPLHPLPSPTGLEPRGSCNSSATRNLMAAMEWTDGQAKSSGKRARTHWICGAYPPLFLPKGSSSLPADRAGAEVDWWPSVRPRIRSVSYKLNTFEEKASRHIAHSSALRTCFFDLRRRDRILLENRNRRSSLERWMAIISLPPSS